MRLQDEGQQHSANVGHKMPYNNTSITSESDPSLVVKSVAVSF